jgi:hypothetical protein
LIIEQPLETASLKHVADAEEHFGLVQWLEQEIGRASAKSAQFTFPIYICCENDNRQKDFAFCKAERFEHGKTVKVWHHQIEEDQVWRERLASLEREARIGNRLESLISSFGKHGFEESDIYGLIVDDKNLHFSELR